jgi:hypothetical protein
VQAYARIVAQMPASFFISIPIILHSASRYSVLYRYLVTIILSVVLYGCKTWSLTWKEERMLRVFENRVLMRIFGPKRDDVTGEWRKLHDEELHDHPRNPKVAADGCGYSQFKCLSLHLSATAFSLSSVKRYI